MKKDKWNRKRLISDMLEWARYMIVAIVAALFINNAVIVNAEVISPSMEDTLMTDSRVVALRPAYLLSDPQRFDVIIFKFPDDENALPYVKRIIGLPNEQIEIRDGKVYIDDSETPLNDSFIKETSLGDYGPFIVPEDSYFVLGDNRNNSYDSRLWENKYVPRDKILGKVILEYSPDIKILN